MALTQDQWYEKLRRLVPGWWFEEEDINKAVFHGFAKVLSLLDASLDDHIQETYICESEGAYLDEHGLERNLVRLAGEIDASFCERVRNIVNSSNCPSIKAIVDALLEVGESTFLEDFKDQSFFNREDFFNRGKIWFDFVHYAFSILVDKQVHEPYSFFSREYFLNREDFYGTNESSLELFQRIVEAVNKAKAFGVAYRLIERLE